MDKEQSGLQIFASFREVNQALYQSMLRTAQSQGITHIQYLVLKMLAEKPQIGLSELADCIFAGNSTTSGIVDRMVKAGWVVRERPEADRRQIALKLTPEGEELWRRVHEELISRMAPLLTLPDEDVAHLLRIHGQIVQILQTVREGNQDE